MSVLIELGLILAVGKRTDVRDSCARPHPSIARPRCAKLTLVSNPAASHKRAPFSYLFSSKFQCRSRPVKGNHNSDGLP